MSRLARLQCQCLSYRSVVQAFLLACIDDFGLDVYPPVMDLLVSSLAERLV